MVQRPVNAFVLIPLAPIRVRVTVPIRKGPVIIICVMNGDSVCIMVTSPFAVLTISLLAVLSAPLNFLSVAWATLICFVR